MAFILLLLFIGTPIAEIAVFIEAGERFGFWPTVGAVILTAMIGTVMIRAQGFAILLKAQENLAQGRFPVAEAFDGICLLIAGALLLTPGFITDAIGFSLLIPPVRAGLRRYGAHLAKNSARFQVHTDFHGAGGRGADRERPYDDGETVIDGDWEDVTPNPNSPWGDKNQRPGGPEGIEHRKE